MKNRLSMKDRGVVNLCPPCLRGHYALLRHPSPGLPGGLLVKRKPLPDVCDGFGCSNTDELKSASEDQNR